MTSGETVVLVDVVDCENVSMGQSVPVHLSYIVDTGRPCVQVEILDSAIEHAHLRGLNSVQVERVLADAHRLLHRHVFNSLHVRNICTF